MKKLALIILIPNICFALNFQEFVEVKEAVKKAFKELRPNAQHSLSVNKPVGDNPYYWWESDMVHASYSGYEQDGAYFHHIFLFGGFVRQIGMTKDGLAVTACHEIGHGIGGAPKKSSGSSMEGQSDYYATKTCLPIVFKYLKKTEQPELPYLLDLCAKYNKNDEYCSRSLHALLADQDFFKNHQGKIVDFNQASLVIASELNDSPSFYPEPQCRFDTSIHGALQLERPRCWYPQGIERKL